jgi:hypothetical protein
MVSFEAAAVFEHPEDRFDALPDPGHVYLRPCQKGCAGTKRLPPYLRDTTLVPNGSAAAIGMNRENAAFYLATIGVVLALHLSAPIALAIVIGALLADATNDPGP